MPDRNGRWSSHGVSSWWLRHFPTEAWATILALLLAGSWLATYVSGGTRTALPHVFYIPIVLAGLPFGLWGGLGAAMVATILCGPLMPLNVATGEQQDLLNWVTRGIFFVTVGGVAAAGLTALRRTYEQGLTNQFREELDLVDRPDPAEERVTSHDIAAMLDSGAFHPVFQPVYSLSDGRLVAMEALTRFDAEPDLPPDIWFAAAARAGLGVDLELAAIEAAYAGAAGLDADVALSVNASPDVVVDPRLLDLMSAHTERPTILEITEHAAVDDYRELDAALAALRQLGVKVAIDDAGAGFASLRHIVRLAPEVIKLDISLTQGVRFDPIRRALANSLIDFAHQTGSQLVAEGIEEASDLTTWRELGAHAAQGYLLARPGPLPGRATCALISATPRPALA